MPKPNSQKNPYIKQDLGHEGLYESVKRSYDRLTDKEKQLVNYDIQTNPDKYNASNVTSYKDDPLYNTSMQAKGLDAYIPDDWQKQIPKKNGVYNAIDSDGSINQIWQKAYDNMGILRPFLKINSKGTPDEESNAGDSTLQNLAYRRYKQLQKQYEDEAEVESWKNRVYQKDGVIDEAMTRAFQELSTEEKKIINSLGTDGKPSAVATVEQVEAYNKLQAAAQKYRGLGSYAAYNSQVFANPDGTIDKGKTRAYRELTSEEQAIIQKLGKNGYPSGLVDAGDLAVFNKFDDATKRYNREYASQELAKMQAGTKYASGSSVSGSSSSVNLGALSDDAKKDLAKRYGLDVADIDELIAPLANQMPAARRERIRASLGRDNDPSKWSQTSAQTTQSSPARSEVTVPQSTRTGIQSSGGALGGAAGIRDFVEERKEAAARAEKDPMPTEAQIKYAASVLQNPNIGDNDPAKQTARDIVNRYNAIATAQNKERARLNSIDVPEAQRQLDDINKQIAAKEEVIRESIANNTNDAGNPVYAKALEDYRKLTYQRNDLEGDIRNAKAAQQWTQYEQLLNERDFSEYAAAGRSIIENGQKDSRIPNAGLPTQAVEDIDLQIAGARGELERLTSSSGTSEGKTARIRELQDMISDLSGLKEANDRNSDYEYLNDREKAVYQYLLGKYGNDSAQEFVESIRESINQRKGAEIAEDIGANDIRGLGLGIRAGVDQFETGIRQLGSEDALPTSPMQYASGMYRETLDPIGRTVYDVVNTTANMAPTIVLSAALTSVGLPTAAAGAVTSAVMGASAGGNAYRQAVMDGQGETAARKFAWLTGISEGALQYALGGISELGGIVTGKSIEAITAKISSANLRLAATMATEGFGEGFEEWLQDGLESVYRKILFDENEEVRFFTEDAAYSFLLGFLSSVGLEAPANVSNHLSALEQQRIVEDLELQFLQDLIFQSDDALIAFEDSNNGSHRVLTDERIAELKNYTGDYQKGSTQVKVAPERYDALVNSRTEVTKAEDAYNNIAKRFNEELASGRRLSVNEIRSYQANVKAAADKLAQAQQAQTAAVTNWNNAVTEGKHRATEALEAYQNELTERNEALYQLYLSAVTDAETGLAMTNIEDTAVVLSADDVNAVVNSGIAEKEAAAMKTAFDNLERARNEERTLWNRVGSIEQGTRRSTNREADIASAMARLEELENGRGYLEYQLDQARDTFAKAAHSEILRMGVDTVGTTNRAAAERITAARASIVEQADTAMINGPRNRSGNAPVELLPGPVDNGMLSTVLTKGRRQAFNRLKRTVGGRDIISSRDMKALVNSGLASEQLNRLSALQAQIDEYNRRAAELTDDEARAALEQEYQPIFDQYDEARNAVIKAIEDEARRQAEANPQAVEKAIVVENPVQATTEELVQTADALVADAEADVDNPTAQTQAERVFEEVENRQRQEEWAKAGPDEEIAGTEVGEDGVRRSIKTGSFLAYKVAPPDPGRAGRTLRNRREIGDQLGAAFYTTIVYSDDPTFGKRVLGQHYIHSGLVKVKFANDLQTAIHEVGHHADELFGLRNLPGVDKVWQSFPQGVQDAYGNDPSVLRKEAVAEAFKAYLNNPEYARQLWPQFVEKLESSMNREQQTAVRAASRAVRAENAASVREDHRNTITDKRDSENLGAKLYKSVFTRLGREMFIARTFDSAIRFDSADIDANKARARHGLAPIKRGGNQLYIHANYITSSSARARSVLGGVGIVDWNGGPNGRPIRAGVSLAEVLSPLKTREQFDLLDDYMNYLAGFWDEDKLGLSVWPADKDRAAYRKDMADIERDHPEVKKVALNVFKWQQQYMRSRVVKAGLISSKSYEQMVAKRPYYYSFARDLAQQVSNAPEGLRSGTDPATQMRYGSRENTYRAIQQIAAQVVAFESQIDQVEFGRHLYHFVKDNPSMSHYASEQNSAGTLERGRKPDPSLDPSMYWTQTPSTFLEDDVLAVRMEDGDLRYLKIHDPIIYQYFKGAYDTTKSKFEQSDFYKTADDFLTWFTSVQAGLLTVHKPSFSITNKEKDLLVAFTKTNQGFNPMFFVREINSIAKNAGVKLMDILGDRASEKLNEMLTKSGSKVGQAVSDYLELADTPIGAALDAMDLYVATGMEQAEWRGNINESRSMKKLMKTLEPTQMQRITNKGWEVWDFLNDVGERSLRFSEFQYMLKKSGGDYMLASNEGNRVTTDFRKTGLSTKKFKKFFLFSGANMNGLYQDLRILTGREYRNDDGSVDKSKVLEYAAKVSGFTTVMSIISALTWRAHRKDDDDDVIPDYVEDNTFTFAVGDGKYLKWRVPEGFSFALSREMWELSYRAAKNPEQFDLPASLLDMAKDLASAASPIGDFGEGNPIGSSFLGAAEVGAFVLNKKWTNDYIDQPWQTSGRSAVSAPLRTNKYTTGLAKWLGEQTNSSPQRWDYYLNQRGSFLYDLYNMFDEGGLSGIQSGVQDYLDNIFLGNMYENTDIYSSVYDELDRVNVIINDIEASGGSPRYRPGLTDEEVADANSEADVLYELLDDTVDQLSDFRARIAQLEAEQAPEEQILSVQREMAKVAMNALIQDGMYRERFLRVRER